MKLLWQYFLIFNVLLSKPYSITKLYCRENPHTPAGYVIISRDCPCYYRLF